MYPDDIALVEQRVSATKARTEITWKEFDERANKFSNILKEKGVKKGNKVAHWMHICIYLLVAYFGIVRTGAWVVPFISVLPLKEMNQSCSCCLFMY